MMKNLLFGALVISAGALVAQNLDLKDEGDNSIGGYTHYIYDTGVNLAETKVHVSNSSASPIVFDITVFELANSTPSDWQVCFGVNCFIANHSVSTGQSFSSATAPASGSYNDSKIAPFSFGWANGDWGVWRVKINDVSNVIDSSSAYIVWTMGGAFAGDQNGNTIVDGSEIAGDIDGNGTIDGSEITGDMNGDGVINVWEVSGDSNGNGVIDNGEVLAITEINKKDVNFSIYPNPVADNLTINYSIDGDFNDARVDVYDLLGQKVESHRVTKNKGQLNLSVNNLHAGIYFYAIKVNEKTIKTERVIVK